MKKLLCAGIITAMAFNMCSPVFAESMESAVEETVIEIATAEDLAAVSENLSGNYCLTADIDLEGAEWAPLGMFEPQIVDGEQTEYPDEEKAFTGSFDGQGHTISNFTVNQPEMYTLGLFGCIANAYIGNLNVENVAVDGYMMVGGVVGYSFCSEIDGVSVSGVTVTAHSEDEENEGMYGGVVGAAMMSVVSNCSASADIVIPDNCANAGIVGGGLEATNVIGCYGTGTVTAGNNCFGIGGVSGCGFGAEEFTDCTAENVTITTGDGCFWIGGVTGYAGGYEDESFGTPVTALTNCRALNVTVETGADADGIGDVVGSGFYNAEYGEMYGAPYDAPTVYTLEECYAEPAIAAAEAESVAEDAAA